MVIWITGISASGKTTLAREIKNKFKKYIPQICIVDGDEIRELYGNDLDYSEESRVLQIKRVQKLAKLLSDQGLLVIVSALYSHPDLLNWNRENFSEYYEVYLNAPLSVVQQRDPKGLYAKAAAGKIESVVGIDVPWHGLENPTLTIDYSYEQDIQDVMNKVVSVVPILNDVNEMIADD